MRRSLGFGVLKMGSGRGFRTELGDLAGDWRCGAGTTMVTKPARLPLRVSIPLSTNDFTSGLVRIPHPLAVSNGDPSVAPREPEKLVLWFLIPTPFFFFHVHSQATNRRVPCRFCFHDSDFRLFQVPNTHSAFLHRCFVRLVRCSVGFFSPNFCPSPNSGPPAPFLSHSPGYMLLNLLGIDGVLFADSSSLTRDLQPHNTPFFRYLRLHRMHCVFL